MSRRYHMLPLAQLLPALPEFAGPKTYAAWPVWKDSTTRDDVRFAPLPKKKAVKLYHKARAFERQTRQPGRQDGALGRNGLAVLHALIFDFLDYATGQLDPGYAEIARKACISIRSAARGLASLKLAGVLNWLRRCRAGHDADGRFRLEQDTNAYAVLPSSQWLGFREPSEAPPPHPATWGATPPLPSMTEQAAEEMQHGARRTALRLLACDPGDELAAALASMARTLGIAEIQ
jgi:hypothetical protein